MAWWVGGGAKWARNGEMGLCQSAQPSVIALYAACCFLGENSSQPCGPGCLDCPPSLLGACCHLILALTLLTYSQGECIWEHWGSGTPTPGMFIVIGGVVRLMLQTEGQMTPMYLGSGESWCSTYRGGLMTKGMTPPGIWRCCCTLVCSQFSCACLQC
jgi:hypothetical protein